MNLYSVFWKARKLYLREGFNVMRYPGQKVYLEIGEDHFLGDSNSADALDYQMHDGDARHERVRGLFK